MPNKVELVHVNGKWHLHDIDGNCHGAFIEYRDAMNAAKCVIHNFLIKMPSENVFHSM